MQIILLILKIIGCLVLAVIGLILLLICLVLFTPLRYQICARCEGNLESLAAETKFSFFFSLIRGTVQYTNRELQWEIHLLWRRFSSAETETAAQESTTKAEVSPPEVRPAEISAAKVSPEETPTVKVSPAKTQSAEVSPAETPSIEVPPAETVKEIPRESAANVKRENQPKSSPERGSSEKAERAAEKEKNTFSDKGKSLWKKFQYTFHKICDNIKELIRKKNLLMDFVSDEIHKSALKKLLLELKKLFGRLSPKEFQADIRYGFEDPSITGRVLAVISMIYPMIHKHADIRPDFQQEILQGNLFVKGKVRAVSFAMTGMSLIASGEVRRTVTDIKNFKF